MAGAQQGQQKVWFITGASKGFGHIWAAAALARGDRVAATARNTDALKDLVDTYGDAVLPIQLDVTDRQADIDAIAHTRDRFGRLDVVVNNAGYGQFGAVEELSEDEIRAQFETNFFGAFWVTQAALPIMRQQRSGHIVQVSSVGGVAAFQNTGAYHASKWALEGFSDSLSQEVAGFGISVTLVEPGGFTTDWSGASAKRATPLDAYEPVRASQKQRSGASHPGDPEATAAAILQVVDADEPPLRVLFGLDPTVVTKRVYASRLATWAEWEHVSLQAQGGDTAG